MQGSSGLWGVACVSRAGEGQAFGTRAEQEWLCQIDRHRQGVNLVSVVVGIHNLM